MSLTDEPTPLSPWPFLIADLMLVGTAFAIGLQAPSPVSSTVTICIAALISAGAVVTVLPFVLNHARKHDLLLDERQREIAALAQTIGISAERLSIAAASLHGIADQAARALKQAEQLPTKLQEKIHEFKDHLNEVSLTENETLSQEVNALRSSETERIESVVTNVRKLSADFARLSLKIDHSISILDEKFPVAASRAASSQSPSAPPLAPQASALVPPEKSTPPETNETGTNHFEEKKIPKKRPSLARPSDFHELSLGLDLPLEPALDNEFGPTPPDPSALAISTDGLTRLIVTAYIGIGNKIFARGEGPGLSWERGVPLQFVSIGKWRWETAEATKLVRLKVYKNDEQECTALGEFTVDAGHQYEVSATF